MPESIEKQMNSFEKAINQCLKLGLKKSVRTLKKRTKEINTSAVNKLVYKKYYPELYERRRLNNGLSDPHNVIFDNPIFNSEDIYLVNCELKFYNITKPNPIHYKKDRNGNKISSIDLKHRSFYKNYYLASMIEEGYGNKNYPYNQPRPFIDNEKDTSFLGSYENGIKQRSSNEGKFISAECIRSELEKTFGKCVKSNYKL